MKKIYSLFIILNLFLFSNTNFAQTVYLDQITVNGAAVNNCGIINFNSNISVDLSLRLRITKSATTTIGTSASLKLYIKKNSTATPKLINGIIVTNSSFTNNTNWEGTFSQTLLASDIEVSGSTFYAVYDAATNPTCNYALIKNPSPTFTISPASQEINCSALSGYTFNVNNVYSSPGNLSYVWNVGNGWKFNDTGIAISGTFTTASSSIQLKPVDFTILPSNVSVTPILDGVTQPTKTCVISRSGFAPTLTKINTGNNICTIGTSSTFSLSSLPSGCTVVYSSTNPAVATITSGTVSQVIVQSQAAGIFKIKATLGNACGQTFDIFSQSINVGLGSVAPILEGSNCYANSFSPCVINDPSHNSGYVSALIKMISPTMESTNTYSDWEWENISGRFAFSATHINGNMAYGEVMNINFQNNIIPNQIEFRGRVRNSCGWSNWKNFIMTFSDGVPVVVTPPVTPPSEYYNISPNPASSVVNITLKNPSLVPPNASSLYVSVFTTSGTQVIPETWINSITSGSLYVGNLASLTGYLLKIKYGNTVETKYLMKN